MPISQRELSSGEHADTALRVSRARIGLEGLSVGDAFGENFFMSRPGASDRLSRRMVPGGMWHYTDDAQMALSIFAVLRECGTIDQDRLAASFAKRYERDRGYGPGMRMLLAHLADGGSWRELAPRMFGGSGSLGNGCAMRIAPLGGYFADDLAQCAEQARLATEVTHAHPEGIAGGIAAAVATALAWRVRTSDPRPGRAEFLDAVLPYVPDSEVRAKIEQARDLDPNASVILAVAALGNGSQITAMDTVPFCLWCAAGHLDSYEEALWHTVTAGGDVDTNCAIVGGIVALSVGMEGIPALWRERREPLPAWAIGE